MGNKMWYLLVLLRLILVFFPQTGYIHPDEFFQTVEVVAGDIFKVNVVRSWEFSSAIRSIIPPYVMAAPVFCLQKVGMNYLPFLNSSYLTLILPRCAMFLCSLVVDYSVCFIASLKGINKDTALMLVASSYATIVFLTRTFTNSAETILFSCLLILIYKQKGRLVKMQKSESCQNVKHRKNDYGRMSLEKLRKKYKDDEVTIEQLTSVLNRQDMLEICGIAFLCCAGFFTRPTFPFFASVPVLLWLYQSLLTRKNIANIVFILMFGITLTFTLFVVADSIYYSDLDFLILFEKWKYCFTNMTASIQCEFQSFISSITVTPWNFIKYNTNHGNLVQHGLHPKYLHLLVNLPLLFGPMVLIVVVTSVQSLRTRHLVGNIQAFLIFLVIPIALLSLFPHQEPRFLLPLLPVIVLTCTAQLENSKFRATFLKMWFIFNFVMCVVFGFFHQGGIVSSLLHIQKHSTNVTGQLEDNIGITKYTHFDQFVFYHTYMPPEHLLLTRQEQIIDLKGGHIEEMYDRVQQHQGRFNDNTHNGSIYILVPGTLVKKIPFKYKIEHVFSPHLSLEDPPELLTLSSHSFNSIFLDLKKQLSLVMLKVI